jgi:hypothetical protein
LAGVYKLSIHAVNPFYFKGVIFVGLASWGEVIFKQTAVLSHSALTPFIALFLSPHVSDPLLTIASAKFVVGMPCSILNKFSLLKEEKTFYSKNPERLMQQM